MLSIKNGLVMKSKKHMCMYWGAVLATGLFYMFLNDLAWFGRIGKHEEIWWRACYHLSGNQHLVCMANYDILTIYVLLGLLIYLGYKLVPVYQKQVFLIPLWGILANICCFIALHTLLYMI